MLCKVLLSVPTFTQQYVKKIAVLAGCKSFVYLANVTFNGDRNVAPKSATFLTFERWEKVGARNYFNKSISFRSIKSI
jgi:hypothetical protein